MPTFQLDDIPIGYEMVGEGVPLVFVHQVATDHRLWLHQRTHFCDRYRLIIVDMMGHGKLARPKHELSIEHAARRIQRLLKRVKAKQVFMIGVSMGAAVAVQLALDDPTLVRGLVLVSPWMHADEHVNALVEKLLLLAEADSMADHMDLFFRYLFPPAYLEKDPPELDRLRDLALEQNAKMVAYAWAAGQTFDLRSQLSEIKVPTLVIAGMNDLFSPPYLARAVAERMVKVELEFWEDTGHFPFIEDPLRFNRRLDSFITRCLAEGREAQRI